MRNEIMSHSEMCQRESTSGLQQGMNFGRGRSYSIVLMSQRPNAPYRDTLLDDGRTLIYEGHDAKRGSIEGDPKHHDQPERLESGKLTQNGRFHAAAQSYKLRKNAPERVRVYDKIKTGIWSYIGTFYLVDSWQEHDGVRKVFRFKLELCESEEELDGTILRKVEDNRIIPSSVKVEVWKRDGGRCVICGSSNQLHFDHDIPYSRGGTSLTAANIRLLCARHNLKKGAKIE